MECNEKVTYRKPMRLRILPVLSVCIFLGVWQLCVGPADSNDWRIPGTSIFGRKKDLAEATARQMDYTWTR